MEEKKIVKQNNTANMRRAVLDAISDRGELNIKKQEAESMDKNSDKQKENNIHNSLNKIKNKRDTSDKKNKIVKIKKIKKFKFGKYLLIFSFLIFSFLSVFGIGICRYGWDGKISKVLLKFIPYPAAIVGNDLILYKDYSHSLRTVLNRQNFNNSDDSIAARKNISVKVLDRLITDKIIKDIALERKIKISKNDVENNLNEYSRQFNSEEEFIKTLKEFYLLNIDEFKAKIIHPILLQNSINDHIVWSDDFNQDKIDLAGKILNELKLNPSDKKFIELAMLHSEDLVSVKNDGDLGWFKKGMMVKEFEDAAFSLQVGEISGIVRTQFGFHIIKVEGKKDGKIKARHILIKVRGLEEVLQERKKEIRIWKFVKF